MKVIVLTSDKYLWSLRPFAYLFNVYWSAMQDVIIVGYEVPKFYLPANFTFYSAGKDEGAEKWTNGIIKFLRQFDEDHFVLLLDDYWLCRGVNHQVVSSMGDYIRDKPDVLRIDLTADRAFNGHSIDVDWYGSTDIIETDKEAPYQWSTQAALINRRHMLACLKPDMSPWDFELRGNELIPDGLRVLGTRQYPVRYVNAIGMGCETKYRTEHIRVNALGTTVERIEGRHIEIMLNEGILPDNEKL